MHRTLGPQRGLGRSYTRVFRLLRSNTLGGPSGKTVWDSFSIYIIMEYAHQKHKYTVNYTMVCAGSWLNISLYSFLKESLKINSKIQDSLQ